MQKGIGTSSTRDAGPVERIARIAEVIETSAARNEELGRLAPEVVEKLHEQQLFRMLLPRDYGGEELDLVTWFRAMEALAKWRFEPATRDGAPVEVDAVFEIPFRLAPKLSK